MKKTDKPEGFITLSEEQLEAVSGGLEEAAAHGTENKAQEQQFQNEQQNPQLITLGETIVNMAEQTDFTETLQLLGSHTSQENGTDKMIEMIFQQNTEQQQIQFQIEQQNSQLMTHEQILENLGEVMQKPTSEEMLENLKQILQQNAEQQNTEQQQAAPATPGADAQTLPVS